MPNFSNAQIIGHLGSDAQPRQVGEHQLLSFSIAYTRKRKSRGEATETTTWFRCDWWGNRGPAIQQFLQKGKAVMVVGELYEEAYTKDGVERKSLKIDVRDVVLLGDKVERPTAQAQERIGRDGLRQNPPAASADDSEPPF